MTRSDARKAELDTLVYVANENILFKHGSQTTLNTTVYGKTHTAEVLVFLGENPRLKITYSPDKDLERSQTISLTQTPCYFGGFRWWMLCPTCNRRVGKLYLFGQYKCRHCHDLTYRSRKRSRRSVIYPMQRELDRYERADELIKHLRTRTYRGQPTKRYLKIAELVRERSD
jgi:hypothetical protein